MTQIAPDMSALPHAQPLVTRILSISATPGLAEMVGRGLAHDDGVSVRSQKISLADLADDPALDLTETDVIVFEVQPGSDAELAGLRKLQSREDNRLRFLGVTSETLSMSQVRQLMEAGVDEVMPLTLRRPELADAVQVAPVIEEARQRRGGDVRNGVILGITQSRGGIGCTSTVLNLAALLTERKRKDKSDPAKVAVIDLDFQNGVLGASIDVHDSGAYVDFLKAQAPADHDVARKLMQPFRARFDVMAAPTQIAPLDAMSPQMMATLLDELRLMYDYVILDLPRAVAQWFDPMLSRVDQLIVLTDLTVHSTRQVRRMIDGFSEDHVGLPVDVVVSMSSRPFSLPQAAREAEKFLDRKLTHWIPRDDRTARQAADVGEPMAIRQPRSQVVKALRPVVKTIVDLAAASTRRQA